MRNLLNNTSKSSTYSMLKSIDIEPLSLLPLLTSILYSQYTVHIHQNWLQLYILFIFPITPIICIYFTSTFSASIKQSHNRYQQYSNLVHDGLSLKISTYSFRNMVIYFTYNIKIISIYIIYSTRRRCCKCRLLAFPVWFWSLDKVTARIEAEFNTSLHHEQNKYHA
jgi:hypothetical protein